MMVEVGVEDVTWREFLSFPDSEPPAAATPGQVADAAHWESFSTRKQRSTSVFPVRTNSSNNMYGVRRRWHPSAYPESCIGKTTTVEQTPGVVVATLHVFAYFDHSQDVALPLLSCVIIVHLDSETKSRCQARVMLTVGEKKDCGVNTPSAAPHLCAT